MIVCDVKCPICNVQNPCRYNPILTGGGGGALKAPPPSDFPKK